MGVLMYKYPYKLIKGYLYIGKYRDIILSSYKLRRDMKLSETKSFLRISVIYGIHNTVTNKWYIGSCIDFKDRMQRHRYYLRHGKHHSNKLQSSYNKYGESAFEIHILRFLNEHDDRFSIEEEFIKEYNSKYNGYNVLDKCGNNTTFTLSQEALEHFNAYNSKNKKKVYSINRFTGDIVKMFESVTDAANFYNTCSSNISSVCRKDGKLRYMKDHVFVYVEDFDETKDYRVKHHCKDKHPSKSTIEKKRLSSSRNVRVVKVDDSGKVLEEYFSITELARRLNLNKDIVRGRINRNKPIGGFIYKKYNKDIV